MQNWGHFDVSCIVYFNEIDWGTLILFRTNMSCFGILRILEVPVFSQFLHDFTRFFFKFIKKNEGKPIPGRKSILGSLRGDKTRKNNKKH